MLSFVFEKYPAKSYFKSCSQFFIICIQDSNKVSTLENLSFLWFGNIFSLLIFAIPGDDDDAHPPESPEQGPPPGGLPGPQHRVQDAKQEGEGEFTEEIRQEAGSQ